MTESFLTILVEGAGTATAISVLKGLSLVSSPRIRTIVTDMDVRAAGRHMADLFEEVPSSQDPAYADKVIDMCRTHKVDIYIPIIDYGFEVLSKIKNRLLEAGTYAMIAEPRTIDICRDKWQTYEFFLQLDVPTPWTTCERDVAVVKEGSYIVKPRIGGRASLGVFHAKTREQLTWYTGESENMIIQEYVDGQEFTADCLSNLSGTVCIAAVIRVRVETKGGVSTKGYIMSGEITEQITEYVRRIVQALCIPGVCNIQGFVKKNGSIIFTEINPRFAGTAALSIAAGMNSIGAIIGLYQGKSEADIVRTIQIDPSVTMVRYWNEIFVREKEVWTWPPLLKN